MHLSGAKLQKKMNMIKKETKINLKTKHRQSKNNDTYLFQLKQSMFIEKRKRHSGFPRVPLSFSKIIGSFGSL